MEIPNAFSSYKNLFTQLLPNPHEAVRFPLNTALKGKGIVSSDFVAGADLGIFSSTYFFPSYFEMIKTGINYASKRILI